MSAALQIRKNIEEIAITSDANIETLPHSLVPTHLLYNLVSCYEILYSAATNYELIKSRNFLKNTETH